MKRFTIFLLAGFVLTACTLGMSPAAQVPTVGPEVAHDSPTGSPDLTATRGCVQGTGQVITLASELKVEELAICDGIEARVGMTVAIHFVGTLRDGGVKFDSSYDRGQPYSFVLGSGPIQGWDEGIVGMKVGSKRRLIIPPGLAYGSQAQPGIPPDSTLVYDVELVSAR